MFVLETFRFTLWSWRFLLSISKKLSVDEQKKLIPDASIHQAFLEREGISILSPNEQEQEWQKALISINKLRVFLSSLDSYVIETKE